MTAAPTTSSRPTPRTPRQPGRRPNPDENHFTRLPHPIEAAAHAQQSAPPHAARHPHAPRHSDRPDLRSESVGDGALAHPEPSAGKPARSEKPHDEQAAGEIGMPLFPELPAGIQPLAYTPEQAAMLLAVRASWLRRAAGAGDIACTYLGKHLRFSTSDLHAIITDNAAGPRP